MLDSKGFEQILRKNINFGKCLTFYTYFLFFSMCSARNTVAITTAHCATLCTPAKPNSSETRSLPWKGCALACFAGLAHNEAIITGYHVVEQVWTCCDFMRYMDRIFRLTWTVSAQHEQQTVFVMELHSGKYPTYLNIRLHVRFFQQRAHQMVA